VPGAALRPVKEGREDEEGGERRRGDTGDSGPPLSIKG